MVMENGGWVHVSQPTSISTNHQPTPSNWFNLTSAFWRWQCSRSVNIFRECVRSQIWLTTFRAAWRAHDRSMFAYLGMFNSQNACYAMSCSGKEYLLKFTNIYSWEFEDILVNIVNLRPSFLIFGFLEIFGKLTSLKTCKLMKHFFNVDIYWGFF